MLSKSLSFTDVCDVLASSSFVGLAFGLRLSCMAVRVDFLVFNFEVSLVPQDES